MLLDHILKYSFSHVILFSGQDHFILPHTFLMLLISNHRQTHPLSNWYQSQTINSPIRYQAGTHLKPPADSSVIKLVSISNHQQPHPLSGRSSSQTTGSLIRYQAGTHLKPPTAPSVIRPVLISNHRQPHPLSGWYQSQTINRLIRYWDWCICTFPHEKTAARSRSGGILDEMTSMTRPRS